LAESFIDDDCVELTQVIEGLDRPRRIAFWHSFESMP
jgi:hypothetical protein